MKSLGIGLIGYGGIGRVHAAAYRSIPLQYGLPADAVRLVGVAAHAPETARKAAAELGCAFWTADYAELLARPDVDAVDICTPNALHEPMILTAARAGKHILCEKPLAVDLTQARQIVQAVNQAGVKNQVMFNFRDFPAVARAQMLVQEGFLGRVFSFRACYYRSSYINPAKPLSWRLSKELSGGGALFDLGSHVIDLIYSLLGAFDSVSAAADTLIKERPAAAGSIEKRPVDVDDLVLMQARLQGGTLGTLEISRLGTGATNDLKFEIYGEKGALRFSSAAPSWLEVFDTRDPDQPTGGMSGFRQVQTVGRFAGFKAPDWTMAPGFLSTFTAAQYRFFNAVSEGGPTAPTFRDAAHVQAVMAAAQRSSAEQRWVPVEPV